MNANDNLFLHLMKNPYKTKKENIMYTDNLYVELIKKYNNYEINKNIYMILLKKIEIILTELTIEDIVNNLIQEIENE